MAISAKVNASLLCAASVVAISSAAYAQDAAGTTPETVVVTGSRVIADVANSPTPITAVSTVELLRTTPTDIPNALNKLPVFFGSSTPNDPNTGSDPGKFIGNVLNLRNFGSQRTLVLLDGHRQAPSNANGTIDIDTLPQVLMNRVDVVTGGASAVYGSDAVTGVVNFVLNKNFSGVKVDANAGISNYTDGASQQISLTAGTDLFGGRGHLEGSIRYFHQDSILVGTRPWGPSSWSGTGSGTAAQPIQNTYQARFTNFAYGGRIVSCGGCAASNMQFGQNGVITPFVPGVLSQSANVASGGDGVFNTAANILARAKTYQSFERLSYNLNDTTTIYVQALAAQSYIGGYHNSNYVQSAAYPKSAFANNPFLSVAAQAQLANPTGMFADQQYFHYPEYPGYLEQNLNRNLSLEAGIDGTLFGKYDWDLYLSHSEDRLNANNANDISDAKLAAAMDAVVNPANGQIVCQVSLTQYASRYPGCIPLNRFGPSAATQSQFSYILTDSYAITQQRQTDVSGSISGSIFDLPAGPIKAALNGEYRRLSYGVKSNALPGYVDCTGLRLCVSSMPQTMHGVFVGSPVVSDNVFEFAGELNAPLLKDLPFIQSLDLNLAGRFTDYSVSGSVETWKIGLDYHVNDAVHLRATTSVDIRAPTLQDLYAAPNLNHTGFSDPHTGNQNQQVVTLTQGNTDLVPEVARTYTAGIVLTPNFAPGLQMSVDYYQIVLKNAISSVSGISSGVAQVCEASNGTSPLCALFVRPLPFSDHSAANYPTEVLFETLNASLADTSGVDVELNYGFKLEDVWETAPGSFDLRAFFSYQPNNNTHTFVGAPVTTLIEPKGRITTFVTYNIDNWAISLSDRFYSKFDRSSQPGALFYAQEYGKALNYLDLTVSKKFTAGGNPMEGYLNIQNLINSAPPIEPAPNGTPGSEPYGSPGHLGVDNIGRYFTIGVRASF